MKAYARYFLSFAAIFVVLSTVNCSKGGGGDSSSPTPAYGQSCGNGLIYSQFGCQPSCGTNMVQYQGQCQPITGVAANGQCGVQQQYPGQYQQYPGQYQQGYPNSQCIQGYSQQAAQICGGSFGPGYVQVQGQPLPQGTCMACFGQAYGTCWQGDYAQQWYSQHPYGY